MIGQTVSHYRIVEKLGGGGMGVVYRADDTKLRRPVALKFLPPELTREDEAKRRFELEAQAASALDHPNICTTYEIDETSDGQLFIAMAYYPGETLKKKIERGPLKLDEALDYAMQIAQGLVKAHAAGIVHRDIKPANVMVTSDGLVKIVDFGLAKLLGQTGVTRTGTTLGTVAYMSPEQTKGLEVDARSDLWSLGVVLYEMIAGRLPFAGTDTFAIANAIVHDTPPPLTSLRTGVPMDVERVVTRALAKRTEDRYQTAADFLSEVRRLKRESDGQPSLAAATVASVPPRQAKWKAAAWEVGIFAVIAGAVGYLSQSRKEVAHSVPGVANPVQVAATIAAEELPSWSPDGRLIAYVSDQSGDNDIWVTQVGGGPPVNRTADHPGANDVFPRWSPDGRQLAFWSDREGGGIFVMPVLAGGARRIARADPDFSFVPVWSPDGSELAYAEWDAGSASLERRALTDGTTRRMALPGRPGNRRSGLVWSPDGRFLAYVDSLNLAARVSRLWVLRLSDGKGTAITDGRMTDWSPSWSPDSRKLYFVSNRGATMDLWRQAITADGAPDGAAERVTTGLELMDATLSPDGRRVAYTKGRPVANVWRVPILSDRLATWADAQQLTFDHASVEELDVSRDGQQLMISSDRSGNFDLWILPAGGGELQSFTSDPTPDWAPAWSPDGREAAFHAMRTGNREIWIQPINGGPARKLTHSDAETAFPRWSPDGKQIAFNARRGGASDLWIVPATGGEPHPILKDGTFNEVPDWSPDGRWLVFTAIRAGQDRIVRVPATGGPVEPVTNGDGYCPRWAPDALRIFFASNREGSYGNVWSVSPDGKAERAMTNFAGKPGNLGFLTTDGRYLYFSWYDSLAADIWVMDLVPGDR